MKLHDNPVRLHSSSYDVLYVCICTYRYHADIVAAQSAQQDAVAQLDMLVEAFTSEKSQRLGGPRRV